MSVRIAWATEDCLEKRTEIFKIFSNQEKANESNQKAIGKHCRGSNMERERLTSAHNIKYKSWAACMVAVHKNCFVKNITIPFIKTAPTPTLLVFVVSLF